MAICGILMMNCVGRVPKTASRPQARWYQNVSVDMGVDVIDEIYPYFGLSYPVGYIYFSGGFWSNIDGTIGPYFGLGYSWIPFDE